MIKLLIKPQCFKPFYHNNYFLRSNNLLQFKPNISKQWTNNYKTSFSPLKPAVKRQNPNRLLSIFGGGTIVYVIGGLWKHKNCFVHCDTNRLSDFSTYFDHQHHAEAKFDWSKFWHYLKPHLLKLIAAIFAALAVAYFNIKIPELLGVFINTLSKYAKIGKETAIIDDAKTNFINDLKRPAANLFAIYVLQSAFTFAYILLLSQIGEQLAAKLRQDLFKQIVIQDLSFFDQNRTGELVNRLTADVQDFKSSFKQCVSQGLRSFAQLIGGGVSLFLISPQMATIALISIPIVVSVFGIVFGGALRSLSKQSQSQTERATSVCEEALSNIRTVRSCASEYAELELFQKETNEAANLAQRLGIGIAVFQSLTNLFLNGMVLTTLFVGGNLMASNSLTPGELMAFLVASQGVQRSLAQGSILLGTMIRGLTAGTRVFECLAIQPAIDINAGITIPLNKLRGEISFNNVTFSYPTRPDQIVLKNFNLTLKPGQTVALVGASGSGKSTVAALLERFYEPTSGTITIDNYHLHDISPNWLRANVIGYIEQQLILFGTTILENIRYGQPTASVHQIYKVAKLSSCHDFIIQLSDKYHTNVGERGGKLSGGQRQRIAIARALLKQPTILIMDESTAALDTKSEEIVQKALDSVIENRTTLVIAHRLSTIKNADLIVVLDKGQIVETGTHTELMRLKGIYYELVQIQEKKEKEDVVETNRMHG